MQITNIIPNQLAYHVFSLKRCIQFVHFVLRSLPSFFKEPGGVHHPLQHIGMTISSKPFNLLAEIKKPTWKMF